jgi:hypothetical protein
MIVSRSMKTAVQVKGPFRCLPYERSGNVNRPDADVPSEQLHKSQFYTDEAPDFLCVARRPAQSRRYPDPSHWTNIVPQTTKRHGAVPELLVRRAKDKLVRQNEIKTIRRAYKKSDFHTVSHLRTSKLRVSEKVALMKSRLRSN